MRKDKENVFNLRKEGKSYREINKKTKIPLSTLSKWFSNEKWSTKIKIINTDNNKSISIKNLKTINLKKKISLNKKYEFAKNEAKTEFEIYKNDPLFMAGLMIYAGEGDKRNKYNIRVANSEFYLHLIFITFLEKFLKIEKSKIKFWLLLYKDHNIEDMINVWSKELNIEKNNFYKSQVIIGKETNKKLQYGVGNSIISSVILKIKLLEWLNLCKNNFK